VRFVTVTENKIHLHQVIRPAALAVGWRMEDGEWKMAAAESKGVETRQGSQIQI
jgi:hypothetical protein